MVPEVAQEHDPRLSFHGNFMNSIEHLYACIEGGGSAMEVREDDPLVEVHVVFNLP
jgi:hypothetical protein